MSAHARIDFEEIARPEILDASRIELRTVLRRRF